MVGSSEPRDLSSALPVETSRVFVRNLMDGATARRLPAAVSEPTIMTINLDLTVPVNLAGANRYAHLQ